MCEHCHLGCSALGKPRRKMSVVEGMVTGLTVKRSPTGRAWGWLSYYDRRIKETFVASLALAQLMRVTDKVDGGIKFWIKARASWAGFMP